MGPEVVIVIAAAFISGGAIGSAGTLLAQWILKGVGSGTEPPRRAIDPERSILREEVAELHKHLRNMDARLDFTERLLDGAIPIAPPPERMPAPELRETETDPSRSEPAD
ncbi:MAG: hypothetical protein HKN72_14745 [Gemmatimonadetes bacterium]|nr:hypothetical protein [Gemmatimonadota bacterium]NNF14484.1 hypothetical protein [Gemmatimonadota bacterium]